MWWTNSTTTKSRRFHRRRRRGRSGAITMRRLVRERACERVWLSSSSKSSTFSAADGSMTVGPARLYHLVHLPAFGKGTVTITFGAPGVRAYAFTFGS